MPRPPNRDCDAQHQIVVFAGPRAELAVAGVGVADPKILEFLLQDLRQRQLLRDFQLAPMGGSDQLANEFQLANVVAAIRRGVAAL